MTSQIEQSEVDFLELYATVRAIISTRSEKTCRSVGDCFTAYRENFYWPDLWAAREEAEKKKQAELDLQAKRSQVLRLNIRRLGT